MSQAASSKTPKTRLVQPSLFEQMFGSDSETESMGSNDGRPAQGSKVQAGPLAQGPRIPGYAQLDVFQAADVAPWPVPLMTSITVLGLTVLDLWSQVLLPASWMGPPEEKTSGPPGLGEQTLSPSHTYNA